MSKKTSFEYPTLLLVEHGETEFTGSSKHTDRIHGTKYDLPLTEEGERQADAAGRKLAGYDIASIRSSPQLRARQTAKTIGEAASKEVELDDDLKPLDSGYLSGMTHANAQRRMEYYVKNPHKPIPGGQAYGEWYDNASERMARRLKEAEGTPGQAHVDVLHSSEIASMPMIMRGEPPRVVGRQVPEPGKISAAEKRNGKWRFNENWEGASDHG